MTHDAPVPDGTRPRHRRPTRYRRTRLALRGALVVAALAGAGLSWTALPAGAATPTYTALGDSYASGVGTRSYLSDGTSCQRSQYAYPKLVATRVGATLTFAACGGARVNDVLTGQLGSLSAATTYVTVMVGGNDAGFSSVIQQCALPWPWTCWGDITAAEQYMTGTLPGALDKLYDAIRAKAPAARVVVVGYPRLFNESDCQSLARISPGEQADLNDAADLLNATIGARAAAHKFTFVNPTATFTGHAVCDAVEWVNGISDPVGESYHPNRAGQDQGYATLVRAALLASA